MNEEKTRYEFLKENKDKMDWDSLLYVFANTRINEVNKKDYLFAMLTYMANQVWVSNPSMSVSMRNACSVKREQAKRFLVGAFRAYDWNGNYYALFDRLFGKGKW